MEGHPNLPKLQELIGIEWNDQYLLEQAASDESYANENRETMPVSNYRLAFLGDAVLELVVRSEQYQSNPELQHGELSILADEVVRNEALADAARTLVLGPLLGLGNDRRDEDNTNVLARAFEAILGAVYLDQGFETAAELAIRWLPVLRDESSQPMLAGSA